jgi:hypothetical protein
VAALALGGCALSPAGPPSGSVAHPAATHPATTHPAASASAATHPAATHPATSASAATAAPAAQAQRPHEVPTPAPRQTVAGGWRGPVQAVQAFANYYINWNYRTISLHLRALSEVSIGQARSMLSTAADQVGRDYELRRGQVGNSGMVEAIAPVRGHGDQYAVVTRERTTAANTNAYQGLAPAWHVAVATVTRVRGLWVLSAWQPES